MDAIVAADGDSFSAPSSGKAEVAALRNDMVHEALFMGELLGFVVHGIGTAGNLMLEMAVLVCRPLMTLLGASSTDYVRATVNTWQRYLLVL